MTYPAPPCRLYVLPATAAPVALIMRRGPAGWWHLMKWDLLRCEVTPGAWLRELFIHAGVPFPPTARFSVISHSGTGSRRGTPISRCRKRRG